MIQVELFYIDAKNYENVCFTAEMHGGGNIILWGCFSGTICIFSLKVLSFTLDLISFSLFVKQVAY